MGEQPLHRYPQKSTRGFNVPFCEKNIGVLGKVPKVTISEKHHKNLEPETSTLKWLFQLDDSKSLYRKWLEITISIHLKLVGFGVPGRYQNKKKQTTNQPFADEDGPEGFQGFPSLNKHGLLSRHVFNTTQDSLSRPGP